MRQFVGIDLDREPAPDETMIYKCRHLLETHRIGEQLFARMGADRAAHGMKAHIGVDSQTTLIHLVAATAAHGHNSQVLPELLPGKETRGWG